MSFLSVVKAFGNVFNKVAAVVTPLEPVIAAVPVYGPAFDTIFNAVVMVEGLFVGATAASDTKKDVVTKVVNATLPAAQTPNAAALASAIDGIVAALNALKDVQVKVSAA